MSDPAPLPVKNVGDLCDRIVIELSARENELLTGLPQAMAPDPYKLIGDTTTLDENLGELEHALDAGGTDMQMVGCQEANAFLTGFANSYTRRHLVRVLQWKRAHERTLLAAKEAGVVRRQLAGIGVKVDSNYRLAMQVKAPQK